MGVSSYILYRVFSMVYDGHLKAMQFEGGKVETVKIPVETEEKVKNSSFRQKVAIFAWSCDLMTVLATVCYCFLFWGEIYQAQGLSSPTWREQGMCIWKPEEAVNSHTICAVFDIVIGGIIFALFYSRYRRDGYHCLKLGAATSLFTVLHGFGHIGLWIIGFIWDASWGLSIRQDGASLMIAFAVMFFFLSLGPYLGFLNGVESPTCLLVHLFSTWAFVTYIPDQFAFGCVQLVLNSWYCTPRMFYVGWDTEEDISKRVDDGWAVVSAGFLLLMPLVFAEMLACDRLLSSGGHLVYDGGILLILVAYAMNIWAQCDRMSRNESKEGIGMSEKTDTNFVKPTEKCCTPEVNEGSEFCQHEIHEEYVRRELEKLMHPIF